MSVLSAVLDAARSGAVEIVDLTTPLQASTPILELPPPLANTSRFRLEELSRYDDRGPAWYWNDIHTGEHTGTHLDAPSHFVANGQTAEALEVSRFLAPLVVVSVAERAARDEDTLVTVDDLAEWERAHGRIPDGAVVVMDSGWEPRVGQPGRFLNADAAGVMHHPGWSREAAEWLVHERVITGVGTDTISLDFGASTTYEAHQVLLGAGKYGLECVASLGSVPQCGATLVVGAPKHEGGTGGPARLLALY